MNSNHIDTFSVFDPDGNKVFTSNDMLEAMRKLKPYPPGAKLIRDRDKCLLAYNSGYRLTKDYDLD